MKKFQAPQPSPKTIYVLDAMNAVHAARNAVHGESMADASESASAMAAALEFVEDSVSICQGLLSIHGQEYEHTWCKTGADIMVDVTADLYFERVGPLIGHVSIFDKAYLEISSSSELGRESSAILAAAEEGLSIARAKYKHALETETDGNPPE